MEFSVLLSVYHGESADNLKTCFDSLKSQTRQPDEIVLVEDGPLSDELNALISILETESPNLRVVRLEKCGGLGNALMEGMKYCRYPYVARMDTDDICLPARFEVQSDFLAEHPEIDICGSWHNEFKNTPENIIAIKKLPESHAELERYAKKRNPMNHPTVMFRKSSVEKAGGYQEFPLFEDYYLWARMFVAGCKFYNIQRPLLLFRTSDLTFEKRGGWKYAMIECKLELEMYRMGFISLLRMVGNICLRFPLRIIPLWMRKVVYMTFLRTK
ncbi:MAG: glycosyltransferase [Bacteroidaceae bacterium]|nr:glycosyltransferase [Bacteroidaceae bacterium]